MDIETLRLATTKRDANMLTNMYADNAQIQVFDQDHQPSKPLEIHGKKAIGDWLKDICNRDMTHQIDNEIIGKNHLAFTEACQYADGMRVFAASVCNLQDGKIVKQTMVQTWDQ